MKRFERIFRAKRAAELPASSLRETFLFKPEAIAGNEPIGRTDQNLTTNRHLPLWKFALSRRGTRRAFMDRVRRARMAPDTKSQFEPHIGRSVSLDYAAELLGVSRRTIYNRIRDNRLRTVRTVGGSQRVLV